MLRSFLPIVTLSFWSAGVILSAGIASAENLTEATVQSLRNQVRLILQGQQPREAKSRDRLQMNDALATGRRSMAELRFNDRSLARVGEMAWFQFTPNTRTFNLRNGTALFVIPPGKGRTRVQTPNAAAGIRGSALFVRYSRDTNTTLVGALTDSQIEITNQDGTQTVPLQAGQLAIVVQQRVIGIANFDLNRFYQTSPLVDGLDLNRQNSSDPAIRAVQVETTAALKSRPTLAGSGVTENPAFLRLESTSYNPYEGAIASDSPYTNPILQNGISRKLQEGISPLAVLNPNLLNPPKTSEPNTRPPVAAGPTPPPVTIPSENNRPGPGGASPDVPTPPVIRPVPTETSSLSIPTPLPTVNTPPTVAPAPAPDPIISRPQPLPVDTPNPVVTPTTPTTPVMTPPTTPVATTPAPTTPVVIPPAPTAPVVTPPAPTTPVVTTPAPTTPVVTPSTPTAPPVINRPVPTVTTPTTPTVTVTTPTVTVTAPPVTIATPPVTVTAPPAAVVATPTVPTVPVNTAPITPTVPPVTAPPTPVTITTPTPPPTPVVPTVQVTTPTVTVTTPAAVPSITAPAAAATVNSPGVPSVTPTVVPPTTTVTTPTITAPATTTPTPSTGTVTIPTPTVTPTTGTTGTTTTPLR